MAQSKNRKSWKSVLLRGVFLALMIGLGIVGYGWWNQRQAVSPVEIYQGVMYGCEELPLDEQGGGLMHWVDVDLSAPGVALFVTPVDPIALQQGWQYRLQFCSTVASEQQLAVTINASLFQTASRWLRFPGNLARSVETVVADHQTSHIWEHTYLLWWDDQLEPHLETSKPPPENALAQARWGVGGQAVGLHEGTVRKSMSQATLDSRTAVGFDSATNHLYLAVFERSSEWRAMKELRRVGAKEGMLLDGGDSSCLVLGAEAAGVRGGVVMGGWRPVATHLGIRAARR